jgi:molybdopterin-guanine dinucleotide biosynthesis protein A
MSRVAGLLLTGGASRRMGTDKAALPAVSGLVDALRAVAQPVLEVGPGRTSLPAVADDPPGQGPLAALAAGAAALGLGSVGAALVLACDLPLVTVDLLRWLAAQPGTAVPVVDGRPQPLCARWDAADLARARSLYDQGERSLRTLLDQADVTWLDESAWGAVATATAFADVDTPADLARLGLAP